MKDQIIKAVDNIFKKNLDVKKNEKVLIFTDAYKSSLRKIGKLIRDRGEKFTSAISYLEFRPTGCHGTEPPEEAWAEAFGKNTYDELKQENLFKPLISKKIREGQLKEVEKIIKKYKNEAADVVIALSYFSTSHTRFRDLLNRICGTRYASMPLFDESMLRGPMTVNLKKMLTRTEDIAMKISRCDDIEIESPNGTYIILSKKGRKVQTDTGIITRPGSFSNLPAGEVFLAPIEGSASGRLVLEWAPTRKLKRPVTLYIRKGKVQKIEGDEKYVDYLEEKLSEKKENRNIAELGIGTNDRASRPDNILESEKIFGTIHIALGDNSSFGGKVRTSFHQDFVFFKPSITLIYRNGLKRKLMKDGKLLRSF